MRMSELVACLVLTIGVFMRPAVSAQIIEPVRSPTATLSSTLIDDKDDGRIWNQMAEYEDPQLQGGTGRAGGPGSYGAYTFHGRGVDVICMTSPGLRIDNRVHRTGHARFSLDGKPVDTENTYSREADYGIALFHATNLADGNHVLEVEPEDGWIVVDAIRIYQSSTQTDMSASDQSGKIAGETNSGAELTSVDLFNDWSNVTRKSSNWYLDKSNPAYFGNDASRAVRSVDDTERIVYSVADITSFEALIYSWHTPLETDTNFCISKDHGATFTKVAVRYGQKSQTSILWGYSLVENSEPLPPGVTDVAVEFTTSGNNWDPQLSQIAIAHRKAQQ